VYLILGQFQKWNIEFCFGILVLPGIRRNGSTHGTTAVSTKSHQHVETLRRFAPELDCKALDILQHQMSTEP
jgi:hypothetical protein